MGLEDGPQLCTALILAQNTVFKEIANDFPLSLVNYFIFLFLDFIFFPNRAYINFCTTKKDAI